MLRPASVEDVPALADVLARAFARDSMVTWPMVTDDDLVARICAVVESVDTAFAATEQRVTAPRAPDRLPTGQDAPREPRDPGLDFVG